MPHVSLISGIQIHTGSRSPLLFFRFFCGAYPIPLPPPSYSYSLKRHVVYGVHGYRHGYQDMKTHQGSNLPTFLSRGFHFLPSSSILSFVMSFLVSVLGCWWCGVVDQICKDGHTTHGTGMYTHAMGNHPDRARRNGRSGHELISNTQSLCFFISFELIPVLLMLSGWGGMALLLA